VTTLVFNTPVSYRDKEFPAWAQGLGWSSALVSLLMMPGYAIYLLAVTPGTLLERLQKTTRPAPGWGPALEEHRTEWEEYCAKNPPTLLTRPELPACLRRGKRQAAYDMAATQPPSADSSAHI